FGQSPLTLAITLNRIECIKILLEHGASTLKRNFEGWTPFQEATSFGDRETMRLIYLAQRKETGNWFQEKGTRTIEQLST
ncbi:Ankyrin repeat domain-containing protein 13C, partial [Nowakowskiella sp. JEL0078]